MVSPGGSYATKEEIKKYTQVDNGDLGVSDSSSPSDWDNLLDALLDRASSRVDTITQRDFAHHQAETLLLDGLGKRVLKLPHPVISVSTVKEDGTTLTEGRDEDYVWQLGGSLIAMSHPGQQVVRTRTIGSGTPPTGFGPDTTRAGGRKPVWQNDYQNVEVTLDYGYSSPPEDVVDAVLHLVDHTLVGMVQKRQAPIVQTDNFEVSANIPESLNREVKEMLAPYRVTQPTTAKVSGGGQVWGG